MYHRNPTSVFTKVASMSQPSTKMHRTARRRAGLTLVEMLVSVALTLMVVFALVRVFELLGSNVTEGRATIEMSGSLRRAANLLRQDLEGLTVSSTPPIAPSEEEGYLEIVDGPSSDSRLMSSDGSTMLATTSGQSTDDDGFLIDATIDSSVGDIDDVLAFTSRKATQPFTGMISDPRIKLGSRYLISQPGAAPTQTIEAVEGEVIWWLRSVYNTVFDPSASMANQIDNATNPTKATPQVYPNGTPVRSLHRRVFLVRPDLDLSEVELNSLVEVNVFLSTNDISVRVIRVGTTFRVIPNTLGDLTERHNRAFRRPTLAISADDLRPRSDPLPKNSQLLLSQIPAKGTMKDLALNYGAGQFLMLRKGKDVVLGDVMAFDVQVWDPQAVLRVTADGSAMSPSDPGYVAGTNATFGAYVDLGFSRKNELLKLPALPAGLFGGVWNVGSHIPEGPPIGDQFAAATYCTWNSKYEHDGFDQDGNGIADQGANGVDDNNGGGIDDLSERETLPPYPHALRGVKVALRIMDPSTRQVRQTNIIHDFLSN